MHRRLALAAVADALGSTVVPPATAVPGVRTTGTVPTVTCIVKGDAHNRVYALDQTPGTMPTVWRLLMRDSESR